MGKIKWLGDESGASETTGFRGLVMKKDEWVDCEDKDILARAAKNRYFEVEGYDESEEGAEEAKAVPPPSQQSAQYPVSKHDTATPSKPVGIPPAK